MMMLYNQQDYLSQAPKGIDAPYVWNNFPNAVENPQQKTGVVDLERGWNLNHEDLTTCNNGGPPTLIDNGSTNGVLINQIRPNSANHGTAVLGEIAGVDNQKGIVGIAPGVGSVRAISYWSNVNNNNTVANSIITAVRSMNAGDVLLLEVQKGFATERVFADFLAMVQQH